MGQTRILLLALFLAAGLGGGCRQEPGATGPRYGAAPPSESSQVYNFAVYPLDHPAKLFEIYQPLIEYLNRALPGGRFALEASRDYAHFEEKIRSRAPEILLANPWQTIIAIPLGYQVIAMANEPGDCKGVFIARKDSPLKVPADLKGKAVSYPAPTAMAACILPQYFLQQRGIKVMSDIENHYVGSQESAIMSVYLGKTAVGVTRPLYWRIFQQVHPREATALKIIWETEASANNSVMVRNDVAESVRQRVRTLLLDLRSDLAGAKVLDGMEVASFLPAGDSDYDKVRQYIASFEKEVRPVK